MTSALIWTSDSDATVRRIAEVGGQVGYNIAFSTTYSLIEANGIPFSVTPEDLSASTDFPDYIKTTVILYNARKTRKTRKNWPG
jgi:hypothetical protein